MSITDIGYDEGVYYIVMEYIEGETLKTLIDKNNGIYEKEAIKYAIQICSALSAAHKKGIIHRDIKPHNILLRQDGQAKITDFGIAKSVSTDDIEEKQVLGSVYYISPEQAKGEKIDTRTDIYSLGIVLYEMLTGELPFTGEKTITVALKHINEQMAPPDSKNDKISKSLNNIILKATSKNKRDRYQTAKDLKADLVRALVEPEGDFVELPNVSNLSFLKNVNIKKNRIWKLCILLVLIAVIASVAVVGAEALIPAQEQYVTVPDLVGLTDAAAELELKSKNLLTETVYVTSETIDEGFVISQSPEAESGTAENNTVVLTISSGPADLVMPDIYDITLEEAEALILEMGLVLEDVEYEYSDEVETGRVISQMPEAGSAVTDNEQVSLVIASKEAEGSALMPTVTGLMIDKAVSIIYEAGFDTCFVYQEESDNEEGIVLSQSPEQYIQTQYSSEIDLWISGYANDYIGNLSVDIEVPEKESKIKIVVENTINGEKVNIVFKELQEDAGTLSLDLEITSMSQGDKLVKIFINNVKAYDYEIGFYLQNAVE